MPRHLSSIYDEPVCHHLSSLRSPSCAEDAELHSFQALAPPLKVRCLRRHLAASSFIASVTPGSQLVDSIGEVSPPSCGDAMPSRLVGKHESSGMQSTYLLSARVASSFQALDGDMKDDVDNIHCGGSLSIPCPESYLIKWSGPWKTIEMLRDMEEAKREFQFWGTSILGVSLGAFLVLLPRMLKSLEPEETYEEKVARVQREAAH
mmetsp:Transcript_9253/g.20684  ORF Transcript_9253/g.20684 Transcript_9253/m.20684 type:complete len:206 (-) Transcript_9253:62-679(-)